MALPHSGSHLLSQLLGAHSSCLAIGELHGQRIGVADHVPVGHDPAVGVVGWCPPDDQVTADAHEGAGRPAAQAVPVAVAQAAAGPIASYYRATATLEAEKEAQVLARVAGVVEAIVADLDTRRHPFHVAIENWEHDRNIGTVVRTANAFLAAEAAGRGLPVLGGVPAAGAADAGHVHGPDCDHDHGPAEEPEKDPYALEDYEPAADR